MPPFFSHGITCGFKAFQPNAAMEPNGKSTYALSKVSMAASSRDLSELFKLSVF